MFMYIIIFSDIFFDSLNLRKNSILSISCKIIEMIVL